ncbi:MAG: hypothetical protein C0600_04460 [Ignavibacteria bacterium]|nr:MAG: hypothetical protein C0600_04460 [Ignavibacteria bacterium]
MKNETKADTPEMSRNTTFRIRSVDAEQKSRASGGQGDGDLGTAPDRERGNSPSSASEQLQSVNVSAEGESVQSGADEAGTTAAGVRAVLGRSGPIVSFTPVRMPRTARTRGAS